MKILLCTLLLIAGIRMDGRAQAADERPHAFHIEGKVLNHRSAFTEIGYSGYFNSYRTGIPIEQDGSFHANIVTEGIQDLYLYLDDLSVKLFAQPGDTLQLRWDANSPAATLTAGSPDPDYSRGLQVEMTLSKKYHTAMTSLMKRLANEQKAPDSSKFQWINQLYNEEINTALADTVDLPSSAPKILNDIYYRYSGILLDANMLETYTLKTAYPVDSISGLKKTRPWIKGTFPNTPRTINKEIFLISDNYRQFLYSYITRKVNHTFSNFRYILFSDTADKPHFTPMLNLYYTIMGNVHSYPIRDWMATRAIMHGFASYPFDEAESVYKDFLLKCVVKAYHDTLTRFFEQAKALKKGNIAPGFSFQDTTGREITLNGLKGKVLYIDFWGVYCGPCIYDIRNFVPQLHKKYQGKNVAFVNICVANSRTEPSWKNMVRQLGLEGINLLALNWSTNPVCKAYNIIGIPHYVLIDIQGRIASANAPSPQQLVGPDKNDLDKLITQ